MPREASCRLGSKLACPVGLVCPDTTPYDDQLLNKNAFKDDTGNYCNCWTNERLEVELLPKLERALSEHYAKSDRQETKRG